MRSVREREVVTQGYRRSASPKCLRSGFSRKGRGAMRKEYGVSTQKEPFLGVFFLLLLVFRLSF